MKKVNQDRLKAAATRPKTLQLTQESVRLLTTDDLRRANGGRLSTDSVRLCCA
jgi:hypothetical protein